MNGYVHGDSINQFGTYGVGKIVNQAPAKGRRTASDDEAGPASRDTILFLAASPRDLEPLRTDQEFALIEQELRLSPSRQNFRLVSQVAVQLADVSRALVHHQPQIVHFSGHGDGEGGIYVEDALGRSKPVRSDGLAAILGAFSDTVQCVVVNACGSEPLAKAIFQHIDQVIGMRYPVADNAAVRFSVAFYQAVFGGSPVRRAFKLAPAFLMSDSETAAGYDTPVLFSRDRS